MKKKLLIVESPAKIKTIKQIIIDKNFIILSTKGHIKDLPKKKIGISLSDDTVSMEYETLASKDKVIAEICKEAKNASEVFLAPDPDREGEIIAWHIQQEIFRCTALKPEAIHRITFNEITQNAIKNALEHPKSVDLHKVNAQQARRVLDRWVGYEVSPLLWEKIAKGLSAGRVQSVALKLICNREQAIRAFIPEETWDIQGIFFTEDKKSFTAELVQKNKKKLIIHNKTEADIIVKELPKLHYFIESIKDSQKIRNPYPPFMTSTLQQAAYNSLGFSVEQTMQIAQKLYEGIPLQDPKTPVALITYMRTDSVRIANSALNDARTFIEKQFGKEYVPSKSVVYTKAISGQDAHEAIRPIDVSITPEQIYAHLDKPQARLYELIWKRFVSCQMKPAVYQQKQILVNGAPYTFKVVGSVLIFDGFLHLYNDTSEDEKEETNKLLPHDLRQDLPLSIDKITPRQHFTQPPARYTQASLVKELEKEGIGRPSTYATIMKTIQERSYTKIDEKKRFIPTELGTVVTEVLNENFPDIMNIKFTAAMEENLDKIARGELQRDALLLEFYQSFLKQLTAFGKKENKKILEKTKIKCPKCEKHDLVIRFGKSGPFLSCPSYPECVFTANFDRKDDGSIAIHTPVEPKLLDEICPQCTKPLRQMFGKYGPFVACSGYPECKYIQPVTANFKCPESGGIITQRRWKGKIFWGCNDYPNCKFTITGDILQTVCPICKNPFLLKKFSDDTIIGKCPTKTCTYQTTIDPLLNKK